MSNQPVMIRPFLIRAYYDWMIASGMTPYIKAAWEDGKINNFFKQYVKGNILTFNISPTAVVNLQVDEGGISFNARFSGRPMEVFIPLDCIIALGCPHADGMFICTPNVEPHPKMNPVAKVGEEPKEEKPKKPTLTVVK